MNPKMLVRVTSKQALVRCRCWKFLVPTRGMTKIATITFTWLAVEAGIQVVLLKQNWMA